MATHGWALALALLVLALAPLGFRHPISDVQATAVSPGSADHAGIAGAMLRPPSSPAQARQLTPLVHYRVTRRDTVESIATRAGISMDTLVQINRLHLISTHPFGLFRTWTWVHAPIEMLVYPQPKGSLPMPTHFGNTAGTRSLANTGADGRTRPWAA